MKKLAGAFRRLSPPLGEGRPGELRWGSCYCPLLRAWIGQTAEIEVRGARTCYAELDEASRPRIDPHARDFNAAANKAGYRLPEQLAEAVTLCEYCEAYCLGEEEGVSAIPVLADIDRARLRRDLYSG